MKNRRGGKLPDSLELLLDTLCNTFGGVLFIAILVTLLLQLSQQAWRSEQETRTHDLDPARLRDRIVRAEREVARLWLIESRQRELIPEETLSILRALVARRGAARDQLTDAERRLKLRQAELDELAASARMVEESLAQIDQQIEQAREALALAEYALDEAREKRARSVGTPLVRDSLKQAVSCELRYNRFYVTHLYDQFGDREGPNLSDYFIIESEPEVIRISPRPDAGVPLQEVPQLVRALAASLRPHDPSEAFLDLIVRTDSFEAYHTIRMAASQLGYEISVLLCEPTQPIQDRGGAFRGVQ